MLHYTKNIGLYGFGCVGQGLYDILQDKNRDLKININKICVQDRLKSRKISLNHFTFDEQEILRSKSTDVVVELINSPYEAYTIVKSALNSGKSVVTANKKMLAYNLMKLYRIQSDKQVPLLYEAACCGSIPIIRTLEEHFKSEDISSIQGIFNGTSNYILTKIHNDGISYEEALRQAQEQGFAELNPVSDVAGLDAKYKLAIICIHAFGTFIHPDKIVNIGIDRLKTPEFRFAAENKYKIRLVAQACNYKKKLNAFVIPKFVSEDHPLYNVEHEFNAVLLEGKYSGPQFFRGKGAGSFPTGSAVLSDIASLDQSYRYSYPKVENAHKPVFTNHKSLRVYLRYTDPVIPEILEIQDIETREQENEHKILIGRINLQNLYKLYLKGRNDYVVCELD